MMGSFVLQIPPFDSKVTKGSACVHSARCTDPRLMYNHLLGAHT